jgi:hypothetical protein
MFGIEIAPL